MKIAVCIKQVPDTEARLRVGPDGRWIEEEDLPFIINENDEFALEEAISWAEETDGEVTVFTLGPPRATEALRKALALGAAEAVHLEDRSFQDGDAISTGRALAAAISRGDFDLVFTGSQTDDLGFGATGSVLAEVLGWPHAWLVMGVELDDGEEALQVVREMEGGMNQRIRVPLPAVIEVQAGINHPRYASLRGIMKAKRKPIETPSPSDLGLDAQAVGAAGAGLELLSVSFPPSSEGAELIEGEPEEAAAALVEKLEKEARVL
ncbi:MAG: electron transfer flavoprotein subunit beta/FixA family protein [Thermoanaerobaculia bacterium]|nr:electron transfer flavoprotein subunit beta/FixA family protein [Thermoanaerobaculia bacterium]